VAIAHKSDWHRRFRRAPQSRHFTPQHPSPSEPLKGIPAGVQEGSQTQGSRPAPVIGDPRWQGLPRTNELDPHNPGPLPHDPRPGMPGGLSLSGCSHPHTAPAPWASCAAPVPAAGPRCAPPAGSALRGRQSDRAATAAPSGDQPAGWSSIPMERGEAMGKPGRSSGPAPQRGINRQTRSGFPAPSPPSQRERSNGLHHQSERPWQKQGPAGPPPGAA